jgi:hypothetical protein
VTLEERCTAAAERKPTDGQYQIRYDNIWLTSVIMSYTTSTVNSSFSLKKENMEIVMESVTECISGLAIRAGAQQHRLLPEFQLHPLKHDQDGGDNL